jgi:glutaredoxin
MITMKSVATCAMIALTLGVLASNAQAQRLYRIVGADGKVTFSDQPPVASPDQKITPARGGKLAADTTSTGNSILPAELRAAANRFPVTLYTGKDCGPCLTARGMLNARGIPFAEKTIESNEDIGALRRISGESTLPFATIGGQQLKGFSDQEWNQYLDAAGYPKTSQLPARYRNPAPAPLVAKATATAPTAAPTVANDDALATPAPRPTPLTTKDNPAGLKF